MRNSWRSTTEELRGLARDNTRYTMQAFCQSALSELDLVPWGHLMIALLRLSFATPLGVINAQVQNQRQGSHLILALQVSPLTKVLRQDLNPLSVVAAVFFPFEAQVKGTRDVWVVQPCVVSVTSSNSRYH